MSGALKTLDAALVRTSEPVPLWWRDDDAGADAPALARLLDLAAQIDVPIALAVVPAWLTEDGRRRILACRQATVLQHGWAHDDHAPAGHKRLELGGTRNRAALRSDLLRGRATLEDAFGDRFLPVMVPPWNRVSPDVVAALSDWGYVGLSVYGGTAERMGGLVRVDTHADLVAWRKARAYVGDDVVVAEIVRRFGENPQGAVGILSHHLAMDATAWSALARILRAICNHEKVHLPNGRELFQG